MDRFLRESGVDFSKVNYYIEPLGKKKLKELIAKMKIAPIFAQERADHRELGLGKGEFSDEQLLR
jgi:arsenate reductase-like glutaredoxin family protein